MSDVNPIAPVKYSVEIDVVHDWQAGIEVDVTVNGLAMDSVNDRKAVAAALRRAAERVEASGGVSGPDSALPAEETPKVVTMRGVPLPEPGEADPGMVQMMADVFKTCRDGKVRHVFGFYQQSDGLVGFFKWLPPMHMTNVYQIVGQLELLKDQYMELLRKADR